LSALALSLACSLAHLLSFPPSIPLSLPPSFPPSLPRTISFSRSLLHALSPSPSPPTPSPRLFLYIHSCIIHAHAHAQCSHITLTKNVLCDLSKCVYIYTTQMHTQKIFLNICTHIGGPIQRRHAGVFREPLAQLFHYVSVCDRRWLGE